MKNIQLILIVFATLISNYLLSQDMSYSTPDNNFYKELPNPAKTNFAEWEALKNPVNVSFASDNIRYPKEKVQMQEVEDFREITAWKGEKVHTQILIWSNEFIPSVKIKTGNLKRENGGRINKKNIDAAFVRYVMTDEFGRGCGRRKSTDYDSSLVADPIDIIEEIPVEPNTVRPVWLSIKIPANVSSGKYSGTISIIADKVYDLNISVNVLDHTLPSPDKWSFDLDLWQNAHSIAMVHDVPLWSDKHFELMKPYFKMLAAAGQKVITANLIDQPWGPDHIYYRDPTLINWIKRKDGTWEFSYTIFDRYISFMMDCGIDDRINCYSMVTWDLYFSYYDEASGKVTSFKAEPGSPEYNEFWKRMLVDFTRHLKEKGWFEKTAIAMDERSMESMLAVIDLLKEIDPDWKTALAGGYHPEIEDEIYDYCLILGKHFNPEKLETRKQAGKPSTYYTACGERYPNSFTFSPPAENTWIGYYAAAAGFTGYLRWAYNNWTESPLTETRYKTWPAGDCYQIYPGPRTSIRFEKLIEGIQNFEKIQILREKFLREGDTKNIEKLDLLLSEFEVSKLKTVPAADMVEKAGKVLDSF
jgi:hypothetical protein